MPRILVVPEQLRSFSAQLQQVAGDLRAVSGRVGAALGGLDWEARQKAGVDGQVNDARSRANALAEQAEALARYLATKAEAFEEADRQGASAVGYAVASWRDWRWVQRFGPAWNFPGQQIGRFWNLGGVSAPPPSIQSVALPVVGGGTLVGIASLTGISGKLPGLHDFGQCVWNWLRGRGWKTDAELAAPGQGGASTGLTRSRFGDLLKQEPKSETPPKPTTESTVVREGKPEPAPSDQWWKDVPLQSQQGLTYGKQRTAYGCTPTATSMILDYWHAQDPSNKTMSAQELLNINAGQRVFGPDGMSASNIHDEVRGLGYGVVEDHVNSNLDELKEAVAKGPIIAIVKLGMKTAGTNHAVVVTGISPDGTQVRVNDPWDGQSHTYSWEEFSKSWGANFGRGAPKNSFIEIRP